MQQLSKPNNDHSLQNVAQELNKLQKLAGTVAVSMSNGNSSVGKYSKSNSDSPMLKEGRGLDHSHQLQLTKLMSNKLPVRSTNMLQASQFRQGIKTK